MQLWFALLHWLLIAAAAASRDGRKTVRRQGSEDGREGPIEPDTASDCTYFDTAHSPSDNCTHFEEWWAISHEDFVKWVSTPSHFHFDKPHQLSYESGPEPQCETRL